MPVHVHFGNILTPILACKICSSYLQITEKDGLLNMYVCVYRCVLCECVNRNGRKPSKIYNERSAKQKFQSTRKSGEKNWQRQRNIRRIIMSLVLMYLVAPPSHYLQLNCVIISVVSWPWSDRSVPVFFLAAVNSTVLCMRNCAREKG